MGMKHKTLWLTGLKGIAALIVIFRHYANGFFPALHTGNGNDARLFIGNTAVSVEEIINRTPLYLFINGGFAVYIFWILSAYLLSNYYYSNEVSCIDMRKKALKRYLSVLFPIAVTYFVVYLMLKLGWFYNTLASPYSGSEWLAGFYSFPPSLLHLLRSLFVDTFFTANVPYNPVLWTIEIEVKGSFLLALFLYLFGSMKNRNKIILVMTLVILYTARLQYLCFVFGMVLGIRNERNEDVTSPLPSPASRRSCLVYIVFAVSLFLGGYPSDFSPTGVYGVFPVTVKFVDQLWDTRTLIYVMAASGIVYAISRGKRLQGFFENKLFIYMGNLSTEVYMIHLIVECSISSALFVKLSEYTGSFAV